MEGQIVDRSDKKKKRFLIRWFVGRDASGKRRYASRTIHGTKKQAQQALREQLQRKDQGILETRRIPLHQYLQEWIEKGAKQSIRSRTLVSYRKHIDRYIAPSLGHWRLDQLTPLEVQAFINHLSKTLAPASVKRIHSVLSRALRQAVRWQMIPTNPASAVELPKAKRTEMLSLDVEAAGRFRAAIRGNRHEALFLLLLGTGLRPSEALALRWSDLDLDAAALVVSRSLSRAEGDAPAAFNDPKTESSRRRVPMPMTLVQVLRAHRATQGERRLAVGGDYRGDLDLVFGNELGGPLDAANVVRRFFKPALEQAGLPREIRLYDLRHSFATLALGSGAHVLTVANRMGHSSPKQVLDRYGHVTRALEEDGTAAIEEAIFGRGT